MHIYTMTMTLHSGYLTNYVERSNMDTLLPSYERKGVGISSVSFNSSSADISQNCRRENHGSLFIGSDGYQNKNMPTRGILKKSASADAASIKSLRESMLANNNKTLTTSRSELSLHINIPLMNDMTTVATGQTSPKSPQQKNVTFADDNNLSLVHVRNFIPSNDQLDAWTHSPLFLKTVLSRGERHELTSTNTTPATSRVLKRPLELLIAFKEPCYTTDYKKIVDSQCVALERCGTRGRTVIGIILVKNIEFQKRVTVRYTLDHWKTYDDVETSYVPNSNDGVTDRFTFSLSLPKSRKEMEFAVRYQTSTHEYWDNNQNRNYKIKDAAAP